MSIMLVSKKLVSSRPCCCATAGGRGLLRVGVGVVLLRAVARLLLLLLLLVVVAPVLLLARVVRLLRVAVRGTLLLVPPLGPVRVALAGRVVAAAVHLGVLPALLLGRRVLVGAGGLPARRGRGLLRPGLLLRDVLAVPGDVVAVGVVGEAAATASARSLACCASSAAAR